jgi:hypothetical protein
MVHIFGVSYISDTYQRAVQWILTSTSGNPSNSNTVKHMMIISPYKVQELLLDIRKSEAVTLYIYVLWPNLGFCTLDGLDLYTVPVQPGMLALPQRLVVQLNLFTGQLYLGLFKEYVEVCAFLGLAWEKAEEGWVVAADGFIVQDDSGLWTSGSTFSDSPVKFLKVLMTKIRRNCDGIDKTHMGRILDGRLLRPSDFGEPEDGVRS